MRTAFFAKGSHFDRHIDRNPLRDGLTLGKVAETVTVTDVDRMGRGYLAGIRKGDQILEIGGRSLGGLSLLAVERMIYDPRADLRLLIVRGETDRQVIHLPLVNARD
jgi:C-terminal processing protease CtpA/Prc